MRLLTSCQVGKYGVDSLMHTGILLTNLVVHHCIVIFVVCEVRVKASYRIIAKRHHRPRLVVIPCCTLPSTELGVAGIVRIQSTAIYIHRTVISVACPLVGRPSHLVAEEGKIFVHLLQQFLLCRLGDVWVGVRSPSHCPPSVSHDSLGIVVLG